MSLVRWFNERSSNLEEVVEVSIVVSGTTRGSNLGSVLSDHVSEDLSPSLVGDGLARSQASVLLGDGLVEEGLQLILKWGLAGLSELGIFVEFLELLVIGFVAEELERMDVVGHQLEFPISLVGESSGSTVLDLFGWGFRGKWNSEEFSEGDDESFLDNQIEFF